MKKALALVLAVLMVVALFAGCGPKETPTTPDTNTPSSSTPTPPEDNAGDNAGGGEEAPVEDDGPYNFAKGKFEFNEDGYATSTFDYELPLSTTDEVFTYWTTCWTPQYLPEGGWQELETLAYIEELTGVHMEYEAVSSESRSTNFSVLLAADDLRDLMDQATYFYTGDAFSMIEDEWFINFYDYRDYMPNYLYELYATNDIDVLKYGRLDDTTWPAIYGINRDPMAAIGYMLRQDWMDDLGLGKAIDVKTLDDWHNVLTAFKNNGMQWPLAIYKTVDICGGFGMFDTSVSVSDAGLPAAKAIDGVIHYSLTTQDDLDAVTLLSQWYAEGLIDPNYATYTDNTAMSNPITTDVLGCVAFTPSEVAAWEASGQDPDTTWMPTPYVKKTEDQMFKYGHKMSYFHMGAASISAKCDNIPLVCTWLDWKWSPEGSLVDNWGVEGLTYYIDENGNRMLSDFVLNHPEGLGSAWVMVLYTNDGLRQPCLNMHLKNYAYPGGEIFLEMFSAWKVEGYVGEYDIPTGIRYTTEQSEILNQYSNDIGTYIAENWFAFLDGSKPLSMWDAYVADIYALGLQNCIDVVQEAYDDYLGA